MKTLPQFLTVAPIGDTDPMDLPVADVRQAVAYYQDTLGFRVTALDEGEATLARDTVTLRLAQNGKDPEQASCYIGVSDVDDVQREYHARGVPGDISEMEHGGTTYRVIWVRDPDGLCYCIGQPKAGEQE